MRLLALALVAAAVTAGCRPEMEAAPPPHAPYRGPLVSSLQVETAGDTVHLVLQVTNGAAAGVSVTFPTGQSYDFEVRDGGRSVWRWSEGMMFNQAVRMLTIAPGETRTFTESWRVPAPLRGRTLTAVARLASSDHPLERTADFRLP